MIFPTILLFVSIIILHIHQNFMLIWFIVHFQTLLITASFQILHYKLHNLQRNTFYGYKE